MNEHFLAPQILHFVVAVLAMAFLLFQPAIIRSGFFLVLGLAMLLAQSPKAAFAVTTVDGYLGKASFQLEASP